MLKAGINIGLGVDARECHNSTGMFDEVKITSDMQRATREDASLGQPSQILRMVTSNGARVLVIDAAMLVVRKKKNTMFTPLLKSPNEERRAV